MSAENRENNFGASSIMERYRQRARDAKSAGRIHTKDQALADEVWRYFGKQLPFPRIMRMVKEKGHQAIYEVFNEIRRNDCQDRLSLFIYRVKREKVDWISA